MKTYKEEIIHYLGRLFDLLIMPLIPRQFRLMFQYVKFSKLLGWEPETRYIEDFARKSALGIDVGGNIGLWSYAMVKSNMFEKVLVFEPNPRLTSDLENAKLENITIIHKAVSSSAGSSCLRIPIHGNIRLDGWASLEDKIDVDTDIFQELVIETIRLDDMELSNVGFIKIDVEGHELNLLAGAVKFFVKNRPVCIIECREKNRQKVEEYFINLNVGYRSVNTMALYNFELSQGNIIYTAM